MRKRLVRLCKCRQCGKLLGLYARQIGVMQFCVNSRCLEEWKEELNVHNLRETVRYRGLESFNRRRYFVGDFHASNDP